MRRLAVVLILGAGVALASAATARAYCGAERFQCRELLPSCKKTCYTWCTVMKPCRSIEYDEEERTFYKTVFEQVMEKQTVEAVKYVEEVRYRCVPTTVWQEQVTPCPGPTACAPAGCGAAGCGGPSKVCSQMVPEKLCRKAPYKVVRPVRYEKVEERPRVVVKQVPYTITVCIPREVIKCVPVRVCCPVPYKGRPCGGQPCGEQPCGCD